MFCTVATIVAADTAVSNAVSVGCTRTDAAVGVVVAAAVEPTAGVTGSTASASG